jgi:hypothetical protein
MTTLSRRTGIAAAALALPLLIAPAAAAAPEPSGAPYAAQQQAYLDGLARAANDNAAEPAVRSAFSAQQLAYAEHLEHAAQAARVDVASGQAASPTFAGDSGEGVPTSVAALLTLGGIALGTGVTAVSRRLVSPRQRHLATWPSTTGT